ncbi:MAG: hypothetical protein H7144_03145 [Burkholderiales bacterium]|nr:hypothetical protein [Phycisphaerae bacterium]
MLSGPTKNLFSAIEKGDIRRCERALLAGADPAAQRGNPVNNSVERPMDVAARLGLLGLVDLLFCSGAPLNADEAGGTRALVLAQLAGHQDVEDMLRDVGARDGLLIGLCVTNNQDGINVILDSDPARWPNYALDSVRSGNVEMVEDNLRRNPVITPEGDGFALVRSAIFQWRLVHKWSIDGFDRTRFQVIHHMLLDWGVDPNSTDEDGRTLIHQPAFYGRVWSPTEDERIAHTRILLHRGADPTQRDRQGLSPLDTAFLYDHPRLAAVLTPASWRETPSLPTSDGPGW